MVPLCSGCNLYEPWAALIVGALGGMGYRAIHLAMLRLKLDDPPDAVAVQCSWSLWPCGIISVPWVMYVGLERGARGIFWDAHLSIPWLFLCYNLQHHFLVCFLVSSCVWCLELLQVAEGVIKR